MQQEAVAPLLKRASIEVPYAMENLWHRLFGEPWVMDKPDFNKLYPEGLPQGVTNDFEVW